MPIIRPARPGDGHAVNRLGALALGDAPHGNPKGPSLPDAIDKGKPLTTPHGHGTLLVAQEHDDGPVTGIIYACPPERWISEHTAQTHDLRMRLAKATTEIEMLAVDPDHRNTGTGSALLASLHAILHARGVRVAWAKVRRGAYPVMLWYRRRGYRIIPQDQPVAVRLGAFTTFVDDGGEGRYQLAVSSITAPR